jgi:hypothetical protein
MRYRVLINGRNFLLRVTDGKDRIEKYGFYATRDVEAESFEGAELIAVDLIRNEEQIKEVTLNTASDPPMLFLEEIRELKPGEESINGSGYTYYREDEDSREMVSN